MIVKCLPWIEVQRSSSWVYYVQMKIVEEEVVHLWSSLVHLWWMLEGACICVCLCTQLTGFHTAIVLSVEKITVQNRNFPLCISVSESNKWLKTQQVGDATGWGWSHFCVPWCV